METALAEARLALSEGEVPIGCALVDPAGTVVAVGRNATHASGDATTHAEVIALRALAASGTDCTSDSLTLYVTCEPCIMCAGALLHSCLFRAIVFGCSNPRFGGCGSVRDLSVHAEKGVKLPVVTPGVRKDECLAMLVSFYQTENPYAPTPKTNRKRKRPTGNKSGERAQGTD